MRKKMTDEEQILRRRANDKKYYYNRTEEQKKRKNEIKRNSYWRNRDRINTERRNNPKAIETGRQNSKAYKELPPYAAKMLPLFFFKVKRVYDDPERYTTPFFFPYSEAEEWGCAPRTFSKVIKDLVGMGFIGPVKKGGLRGGGLDRSEFKLSRRWERYGRADFVREEWGPFAKPGSTRQKNKPSFTFVGSKQAELK